MSTLLLVLGALLLRYLAFRAQREFRARYQRLLGTMEGRRGLARILRQQPERRREFLVRVLPYSALQFGLDVMSSGVLVLGFWTIPPTRLGPSDLWLLRRSGMTLLIIAGGIEVGQLAALLGSALGFPAQPKTPLILEEDAVSEAPVGLDGPDSGNA